MTESIRVPGLAAPVDILVDEWGVPHLYADSDDDLFLAQGFNAARDRLFQLDLWRRRGLGLLSEVLGEAYVEQDAAARAFLYQGDPAADWAAYGPRTRRIAERFVHGVNAYIDWAEGDPARLPPEFGLLGYAPARWAPEDVTRIRSHGLFYNAEQELARALTLRDHGALVERLRTTAEPPIPPRLPEGLDAATLSSEVLRSYRLALAPVTFATSEPAPVLEPGGSNNWVVGPSRTATGRPILANDPHRAISLPSLRYLVHLVSPTTDVIGAGEPSLPGVSIGHNGRIAFGFTIFAIDHEDLMVYETHPEDPLRYRYDGGWERMRVRTERIPVAGGSEREIETLFTRHGPVLHRDADLHAAIAIRAAWLEPGMAPYLGSVEYMSARDEDEFLSALERWGAPGENQVFATAEGRIGWQAAGALPLREGWTGATPVPGDGSHEWRGIRRGGLLPREVDPERGWIATANQYNMPESAEVVAAHDWASDVRHRRIAQLLAENDRVTVSDCVRMQGDTVSLVAVETLDRVRDLPVSEEGAPGEWELLRDWDGDVRADSTAATIFEVWFRRHLRPALLRRRLVEELGEEAATAALPAVLPDETWNADGRIALDLLRRVIEQEGAPSAAALIRESLTSAVDELERLLGSDRSLWAWGGLHRSELRHPLAALPDAPDWTRLGPRPRGGSGDTVDVAPYGGDFVQTSGASLRVVIDVGSWDDSVAMNMPGQSGDPRSPHFADQYETWLAHEVFPLLYTREAIEPHVELRIRLEPV